MKTDPRIDAYIERCTSRPAAVRGRALDDATGVQIAEAAATVPA